MRTKAAVLLPLIAILFSCSSTKKATTADVQTEVKATLVQNITIDGNASDWQNVPQEMSSKGTFHYAIAQDAQNLYIMLKVPDYAEQMKLLRGGMEVYMGPNARENKTTEVIFPVKDELNMEAMRFVNRAGDQKEMMAVMHNKIKSELISLNRIGFKPEYSGVQSIFQNTGFKGAINWDDNNMLVYELQVPLSAFPLPIKGKDLGIGFSLHGLERPSESSSTEGGEGRSGGERGGGMRGGGGGYGGMRGGGMRGGAGRGEEGGNGRREGGQNGESQGRTDWKKLSESESVWVKYKSLQQL